MAAFQLKNELLTVVVLVALIAVSLPSCTHEPVGIDELDTVCYETQVLPILQTSCGITGCHASGSAAEGFDISSYESIMEAVVPGDPRGSKLYSVITDINSENMMPPGNPLTREQRTVIQVWIAQGALKTLCAGGNGNGNGNGNGGADSICFLQNILPIFISNCAMSSCHDGLSQGEEDELYPLNSYATIRQHVVPFNPSSSDVYRAVNGAGEEFMPPPPKSPLTASQKELLRKWIAEGALNSDCPNNSCDTTGTIGFSARVKPLIDNYCVTCHNASVTSGGVNLNGYSQVKTYAESMRNGTPLLIGAIRKLTGFKAMPPSFTLDECSIRMVELWIDQGKLNN